MYEQFKEIMNAIFEKEISTCIQKDEEVFRIKICGFDDGEYEDVYVEIAIINNETDKYYEKRYSLLEKYEKLVSKMIEAIMNDPITIEAEVRQIVDNFSFVSSDVKIMIEEID